MHIFLMQHKKCIRFHLSQVEENVPHQSKNPNLKHTKNSKHSSSFILWLLYGVIQLEGKEKYLQLALSSPNS